MRILLDLEALNDQKVWDASDYRKVQGFVYDKLIGRTEFRGIHNLKNYKFFCFSNIFPLSIVRVGEVRRILISSPNLHLIRSILSQIKDNLIDKREVNIGEQQYIIKSAQLFELNITGKRCAVRTSTPISIRIPEKAYNRYNIRDEDKKKEFLYWRSNLSSDIFLMSIENNIRSKYKLFFDKDIRNDMIIINSFSLIKEVVVHIPVGEYTLKVPASFWKFYFEDLDNYSRSLLKFILDTGMGERNSMGLGFLNVDYGAKIVKLQQR